MHKFTFLKSGWLVVAMVLMAARSVDVLPAPNRSAKDTLIIRTDTVIDNFLKDSLYRANFKRVDIGSNPARPDSNLLELPGIVTGDLNSLAVCAGSVVTVPFTTSGRFAPDNRYVLQLVNPAGKVTTLTEPTSLSAGGLAVLTANIPLQTPPGGLYSLRVASTSPVVNGTPQRLRILPAPSARIELPDGGATTTIVPGQSATLRVVLSGQGPWSFVLSDGTKVTNVMETPYDVVITPSQPGVYKVQSVSGPCGSGTVSGEVLVNVNENPTPVLTLKAPTGGWQVCTGTPFQVAFTATGKFNAGNGFVVQLAGTDGNWSNISASGAGSPLTARLPYGIDPKKAYQLRVVSTFPTLISSSAPLAVAQQAVAVLRGDTLKVEDGKTAELSLDFKGGGPWFVLLSDGTYENGITKTPHTVRVTPQNTTTYTITSAGGACGVGDYSGRAVVRVNVPPSGITTGSLASRTVCYGSEIAIPFTTTGRFYAGNKYIVQVADTSGKFHNMLTTYRDGVLRGTLSPPSLRDTLSAVRVRVVSTSPVVNGTETTINMLAPNAAHATLTGTGTIRPGQTTKARIAFRNGMPPFSFSLSDGTQVNGTFLNPYVLTLAPATTTEYTITGVKSGCGTGRASGKVQVTVEVN